MCLNLNFAYFLMHFLAEESHLTCKDITSMVITATIYLQIIIQVHIDIYIYIVVDINVHISDDSA